MRNRLLSILLVEDNADDAALLTAMLERAGYLPEVHRVETAGDLRAALRSRHWDVIISDYALPEFSAPEALRIVRELGVGTPAIVVSGTIGEDVAVETLRMGAQDYLLKGNLMRLASAVERALSESENLRLRHAAEEAVRRDAQIFAQLQESVVCVGYDERILYWGGGAEALYGWTAEEIVGRPVGDLFPGGETDSDNLRIQEKIGSGHFEGEVSGLRKDGSIVWLDLRIHPLLDDRGEGIGYIGVARDISERRRSEQALRLRDRALAEVSQGVLISDEKRHIIYANDSFTAITGYDRADILGKSCSLLQGPRTDPQTVARMRAALDACEPFDGVILNYRKDGTRFWNELSLSPITDSENGTVRFIGILRDITERISAEEELRDTVERMRVAADSAGVGIFELDLATGLARWDERMFALFGKEGDFTSPRGVERWFDVMSPGDAARCNAILDEVVSGGRDRFAIEFHIRRYNNGERRLIESTGVVRRNAGGEPVKIIGTNRDVTAERAREENLAKALEQEKALLRVAQAAERAKGEFLAVMSHEIRTPMNGILGFAELLRESHDLPAQCRDYAETIATSGEALLRILDDVLDFSRLETGRLQVEKKDFRPREMIEDVRLLLCHRAKESGLSFSAKVDDAVPERLVGDVGRLRQVLINLVGNAIKFTQAGGIEVELRRSDSEKPEMECIVRDTGPGIGPEQLGRIFEPFEQLESSASRRHGGTGLGLAISRGLMTLLGGNLTVRSEVGRGSAFTMRFPVEVPTETDLTRAPAPALDVTFAASHPLKVMVVEDDAINLKLVRALMRRLGYEPLSATNGREAVEIAANEHPDCIFMDLQMPEMDGIEATEAIRCFEKNAQERSPIYISALTANIVPADRQRCFDAGMNDYLNKPVKIARLAEVLSRAGHGLSVLSG